MYIDLGGIYVGVTYSFGGQRTGIEAAKAEEAVRGCSWTCKKMRRRSGGRWRNLNVSKIQRMGEERKKHPRKKKKRSAGVVAPPFTTLWWSSQARVPLPALGSKGISQPRAVGP